MLPVLPDKLSSPCIKTVQMLLDLLLRFNNTEVLSLLLIDPVLHLLKVLLSVEDVLLLT